MTHRKPATCAYVYLFATLVVAHPGVALAAFDGPGTPTPTEYLTAVARADRVVAPASLYAALAALHKGIPAFSRQTGYACSQCHYHFPQLTPFGRMFKLNGYTLTGLTPIVQPGDTARGGSLKLSPIPPVAAMAVISAARTAKAQPETQNNTTQFPQEFSVFLAGQLTPNVGAFTQITYAAADAAVALDNVDIRYATHTMMGDRDLLFGLTLHNNPTVQDVWNTVPAWSYPFMASEVGPSPMAGTLIDGALAQQVVGFGAYSLFNEVLYTELTAYRSAPQGGHVPLDSTAENTTKGIIPYWRAALQHVGQSTYLMLGTYGFSAQLYPTGITGPTNRYTDVGVDAQVEQKAGTGMVIGRAAFVHEQQALDAMFAAGESQNLKDNLSTARASVSFLPSLRWGATLGYFQTSGSSDTTLFAPAELTGSRTGSPNTSGIVGELDFNAWQNTRFGLQYVAYGKFNGAGNNYDVAGGRRAGDNNTLYLYTWIAF
jgi:hypothetical protein